MSILIKGMEMPKGCLGCPCINAKYDECMILQRRAMDVMTRMTDCPLIELPDHGDLIDRDAMAKDLACDVEMDNKALYDTDSVGIERKRLRFDKAYKQNCMYYLMEREAVIMAERSEE